MASRLAQMQARFQQKQMQEKEEKLVKLYENQQQRAFDRVGRGSAGSNTSVGSVGSTGGGKVRQMFDERRQKAGVDRSYPLEPLKSKTTTRGTSLDRKNTNARTVVKSTVQKSVTSLRNGKPLVNKREVVQRAYNNNNGDESYDEQRFDDVGLDTYNSNSHRDMIAMLNRHNIRDDLDNEEMPQIGFDEVDATYSARKSLGFDKIPSENMAVIKDERRNVRKTNGVVPTKKDSSNVLVKKTVARTSPAKTVLSPKIGTPTRTSVTTTNMSKAKVTSSSSPSRAPSSTRPSAKQSARSAVVRDDLAECNYCGRRFAADRLQKHEDICSKTGKKKRKAYDATKHRVVGTELESYVLRVGGGGGKSKASHISSKSSKTTPKKDWRKTHEEFIAAIRAAKEAQAHLAKGGKLSDLPPPPPSSNPDYVQCPHCGRRFNESAAERHIPKCANFQFNKPKPNASQTKTKPLRR